MNKNSMNYKTSKNNENNDNMNIINNNSNKIQWNHFNTVTNGP